MEIRFMNLALIEATQSPDQSTQNGAVIIGDGELLGRGNNTFPRGVKQTSDRWERPTKYSYVEHAERNAIFDAAKRGNKLDGAEMYCVWSACSDCARAIAQTGLSKLIRVDLGGHDSWNESIAIGDQIMTEAGVEIVSIPLEGLDVPTLRHNGGLLSGNQ